MPRLTMPRLAKPKQKPPHASVFEALAPLNAELRRMFSGFAFQLGGRIEGMLRDHRKSPQNNDVWLVLSKGSSPAAPYPGREFPSICPIYLLGNKIRSLGWQSAGELFPTLLHGPSGYGPSGYRFHRPAAGERTRLRFIDLGRRARTDFYDDSTDFGI